jgi:hypothetical protein
MAIPLVSTLTSVAAGWQGSVARSIEAAGASLNEMTLRLSEQLDRLSEVPWRSEARVNDWQPFMAITVTAIIVSGVVCLAALGHWRRVQEARYRTLEVLSREGRLQPQQVAEFLDPSKRRLKLVMILGWLGIFAGVIMLIASAFEHGSSQDELIVGGFGTIVAAFGILATPMMLRELRRQGVL